MITNREYFHIVTVKRLILLSVFLAAFIGFSVSYVLRQQHKYEGKIYPSVFVNGVYVGNKPKEEVERIFSKKNEVFKKVKITFEYDGHPVATYSGTRINIRFDTKGISERAYLIGRSSNFTSRIYQQLATIFNLQEFNFQAHLEYDKQLVKEFVSTSEDKYNSEAKNALFKFEDGKVVSFRQEEYGVQVESDKFMKAVEEQVLALENKVKNINVILPYRIIRPEVTLAESNNFGIEELIAEGISDFSHSIPERIHNIILASSKFNGVLIPKNKQFSFNNTVGDISSLTGYKPAYIIKNGRTVLGDGGGVCQVSTTLFRAALKSGLPITERLSHAYRVSYYENDSKPGFDATVFAPYADLKFKNDTPADILIQTEIDEENNILYFRLYGKKDDRAIEISEPTVYDVVAPPAPLYQDDPTLKRGVIRQTDFSAWGAKSTFHYRVSKKDKVLFEKDFFSSYRPWQAVYLVGIAE